VVTQCLAFGERTDAWGIWGGRMLRFGAEMFPPDDRLPALRTDARTWPFDTVHTLQLRYKRGERSPVIYAGHLEYDARTRRVRAKKKVSVPA
jgi:hypothetical protein